MVIRYRWMSVFMSSLMIMLGIIMLTAFLDFPALDRIIGATGGAITLIYLVQLGASLIMPDEMRCPKCGEHGRLSLRMSGAPEIRPIGGGKR